MANQLLGPAQDPLIGTTIAGRYKLVALLGQGGMGDVYEATQAPFDRRVAVKLLRAGSENEPGFQKRFMLEASVTARLSHPNTITLLDYGSGEQGQLYIAMELLKGRALSRAIHDDGPFSQVRALQIARQIGRSLREAHALGIVHLDLKPANVFLLEQRDEPDFVKVLDFGLGKIFTTAEEEDLTYQGVFMGTPQYVSPEQARNQSPDQRADIYSLGVLLFHMLTGRVPFEADNTVDVILKLCTEPVPALREALPGIQVAPEMEALVRRCLEKRREDRFVSMDELLLEMRRVGSLVGVHDSMPSIVPPPRLASGGKRGMPAPQDLLAVRPPPAPQQPPPFELDVEIESEPAEAELAQGEPLTPSAFELAPPSASPAPAPPPARAAPRAKPASRTRDLPILPLGLSTEPPPAALPPVPRRGIPRAAWIGGGAIALAALIIVGVVSLRAVKRETPASRAPPVVAPVPAPAPAPAPPVVAVSPAAPVAPPPPPAAPAIPARNVPAFILHHEALAEPPIALSAGFRAAHPHQHLVGMYKVCAGVSGQVSSVSPVQGIPAADAGVAAAISATWRYRAQPSPLCAVIPLSLDVP